MRVSIGVKLGVGFGVVIGLLAASAGTAYYNVAQIREEIDVVLDQAVPTVRRCDRLLGELNQASAGLRGYLVTTTDVKKAAAFRADNLDAWREVDEELGFLQSQADSMDDAAFRESVTELVRLINEQREYHQQIEEVAHSEENFPVLATFKRTVEPQFAKLFELLDQVMSEETTLEATAERKKLLMALIDVRIAFELTHADLTAFVVQGDDDSLQSFDNDRRASDNKVQAVQQLADQFTATQSQNWDQVLAARDQLNVLRGPLIQQRTADDWNVAEYIWITQSAPRGHEIRAILDKITADAEASRLAEKAQLYQASRNTVIALAAATLLSIVIGAVVAIALTRRIVSTIRSLADRAKQISEGELRGDAIVAKGDDELNLLADGFNVMLANLRDLTGQIFSVTENVNSAAAEISSSAKQQASSTKEQAATVQEVTTTMQEISQSGAQIVAKAKEVAAVAEQASTASRSGMDAVQGANQTMEAIREQVEEVAENIVALSEKTQAVGEIISTVNEIAEQSNLLALNATIEAAEAGEEGNRFSVVAGEMKNLADQAKECTVHVRKILGEIQKAINTSVMLTEEAVKRVESGKQQTEFSENAIRQISSTTDETIAAFGQIIGATNQQQVGLEQVARGMQDIDQSAQQTAIGTGQLEQAVVSLSAMSTQLRTAVASYKV